MQRRSNHIEGCVAFPVTDPGWRSTGEGGMVVKLVAINEAEFDDPANPEVCAGAQVFDLRTEVLVGDDQRPLPESPADFDSPEALWAAQARQDGWDQFHYPRSHDREATPLETEVSRGYLAAIVLGSTGWSGYRDTTGYWACTFDDLTEAGKALYQQIAALYPCASLHLLTFLDT